MVSLQKVELKKKGQAINLTKVIRKDWGKFQST